MKKDWEYISTAAIANHIESLDAAGDALDETVIELILENAQMMQIIETLWQIIDDIDTASDIFKSDDYAYRKYVEKKQAQRWQTGIETDGYMIDIEPALHPELQSNPQMELNYEQPVEDVIEPSAKMINGILGKLS